MRLYNVSIPVYADNEQDAQQAANAIAAFVSEVKQQGRAVTAKGVADAASKWQRNAIVKNEILKQFPKIARNGNK
jgi:hypothetical protein